MYFACVDRTMLISIPSVNITTSDPGVSVVENDFERYRNCKKLIDHSINYSANIRSKSKEILKNYLRI